jgi:cullin 3
VLKQQWDPALRDASLIRDILMYMDKHYVPGSRRLLIFDQAILLFKETILYNPSIRHRVQALLLQSFTHIRNISLNGSNSIASTVDLTLIRDILHMLIDLGSNTNAVYIEEFETPFCLLTTSYYKHEAAEKLLNISISKYLSHVEMRISQEKERNLMLLESSSYNKVLELLEKVFISDPLLSILESKVCGVEQMMNHFRSILKESMHDNDSSSLFTSMHSIMKTSPNFHENTNDTQPFSIVTQSKTDAILWEKLRSNSQLIDDLSRLYRLLYPIKGLQSYKYFDQIQNISIDKNVTPITIFRDFLKQYMIKYGLDIMNDTEFQNKLNPVKFIQSLLDFRDEIMFIIEMSFHNDKDIHRVLKESMEFIINNDKNKSNFAESLCIYIDHQMKLSLKSISDMNVDFLLSKCLLLFRFLYDKDIFESFYKIYLQKRLLSGKSNYNEELERNMFAKLKSECGHQYITKLEIMLADLKISSDFMVEYKRSLGSSSTVSPVDLEVSFLTSSCWPTVSSEYTILAESLLPDGLFACIEHFKQAYSHKYAKRKLAFNMSKGSCEISVCFAGQRYDLITSTYQMLILQLFNQENSISFTILKTVLKDAIPYLELKRHLLSLTSSKCRILLKSQPSKEYIDMHEFFSINEEFSSKLTKIKVPLISFQKFLEKNIELPDDNIVESVTSQHSIDLMNEESLNNLAATIDNNRKILIEACIVRVMKTRKSLEQASLVAEVIKLVSHKFHPSIEDINGRIAQLIDRDYLERDKDMKSTLHYLA